MNNTIDSRQVSPHILDPQYNPKRSLEGQQVADNPDSHLSVPHRYEVQRLLNGTTSYESPRTVDHLREALNVLTTTEDENNVNGSAEAGLNSFNNKMFTYALLSYSAEASWQPVLTVTEQLEGLSLREILKSGFTDEEMFDLLCDDQSDCPGEFFF